MKISIYLVHPNGFMRHFGRRQVRALISAAALCILVAAPAVAKGGHGAPGPIAGAGLPFIIGAGAVAAYKRRRSRKDAQRRREETE
jgi:hypothetical protein